MKLVLNILTDKETILEAFKNSDKVPRLGDIEKKTDTNSKEVSKIIKGLIEQEKVHFAKHCYYTLK
ncbi:MAG: transcriptional regulator [Promethearchaeota archaeon]